MLPEDHQAKPVEGGDRRPARLGRGQLLQPLAHLPGRPAGEGEGEAGLGWQAAFGYLRGDPVGERARLACARPRDDHQRPGCRRSRPLVRVEAVEQRSRVSTAFMPNAWRRRLACRLPGAPGAGRLLIAFRDGAGACRRPPGGPCGGRSGGVRGWSPGAARRRNRCWQVEERCGLAQLPGAHQPDDAVLPVVASLLGHLTPAQPGDRLAQKAAPGPAQVGHVGLAQDAQLRAEGGHKPVHLCDDLLALRAAALDLADDLRQGYQVDEPRRPGWPLALRAVGQLGYAVQHTNGERLAAARAGPGVCVSLAGLEPDPAFAVPVQVVTAALGMEVDGPGKSGAGAQRLRHGEVVQPGAECGRLPADHRR